MSDKEILEKAIQKAIDNGWLHRQDGGEQAKVYRVHVVNYKYSDDYVNELGIFNFVVDFEDGSGLSMKNNINGIVYDQNFAKALADIIASPLFALLFDSMTRF